MKKILLIGVIAVVLVGGSIGATLFFIVPSMGAASSNPEAAGMPAKPQKAPPQYVNLEPPLVVNFEEDGILRYLQVSVTIMARDKSHVEALITHKPYIRNNLLLLFASQPMDGMRSADGIEALRGKALTAIQEILEEETGEAGAEAVFFTSFVMQ